MEYAKAAQAAQAIIEAKMSGSKVLVEVRGSALLETPLGRLSLPFSGMLQADP